MDHTVYEYWLAAVPDMGGHIKARIQETFPDLENFFRMEKEEICQIEWLSEEQRQMLARARPLSQVKHEYEQMKKRGVRMITWRDPDYPTRLSVVHDAPYALFVKGKLPDPHTKAVGMVGARACSPYGKRQAEEIARKLVKAGFCVVSGMASGVDGISQQTALDHGGSSLAVLGCGVCVCYPEHHFELYKGLTKRGGIISEYPLFEPPIKYHFPQRNRLISALSDAVVVVEAREKSGSLITADFALEQGRDVYAMPGPIDSPLSGGCHHLIEQGAKILVSPEQLIRDLGGSRIENASDKSTGKMPEGLTEDEKTIYKQLSLSPVKLSQLELMTGMESSLIARTIMNLQLRGLVSELSRQCYIRI